MLSYKIKKAAISDYIYIPKYYDPEIIKEINDHSTDYKLINLGDLIDDGTIEVKTGHEIGKMSYGTGSIPFVRTSDISNWEIKAVPKQGVSVEIYNQYADKEDVKPGDILMVRDGSYLIGTTCMVSEMDLPILFQSHVLKFRVQKDDEIDPYVLFLAFNSPLVQRQIRNKQFTSDIIDTIGNRYREIIILVPKDEKRKDDYVKRLRAVMEQRIKDKAAIRQMPLLMQEILEKNDCNEFKRFFSKSISEIMEDLVQDTTVAEFGEFTAFTVNRSSIRNGIFIPKYYDPNIKKSLLKLESTCDLIDVKTLVDEGILKLDTGDEIGKMSYGTGTIPFVRTSDFSNWEIKTDTKQGVSEEVYSQFATKEDIQANDILLVRDGTYLVGTTCMITESDTKMLYCGGLIKIRSLKQDILNPYLLFGVLNSYIVKRQIRTKEFTRDVIDTLGQRLNEVVLPIPRSEKTKDTISREIEKIVKSRINARNTIRKLSDDFIEM